MRLFGVVEGSKGVFFGQSYRLFQLIDLFALELLCAGRHSNYIACAMNDGVFHIPDDGIGPD